MPLVLFMLTFCDVYWSFKVTAKFRSYFLAIRLLMKLFVSIGLGEKTIYNSKKKLRKLIKIVKRFEN